MAHRRFSISSSLSRSLASISLRSWCMALLAASRRAVTSLRASRVSASSAASESRSPSSCTRRLVSSCTWRFRSLLALLASRSWSANKKTNIFLYMVHHSRLISHGQGNGTGNIKFDIRSADPSDHFTLTQMSRVVPFQLCIELGFF